MAHPSEHLPPHSKFRSPAFASSSSSSAASSPSPSPSPSSDILPTHPPPPTTTSTTNSQAFDVPHHLHHSTTIRGAAAAARPNADVEPAHLPSHFYLHAPQQHHHHHYPHPHPHPHHQNELKLPISRHHESQLKMESAHSMDNSYETESPGASAKGILDQTLRSYVHGGVVSPPSAHSLYRATVHGAREQPPSFLHPPEASNRFFPADSSHPLKGGFPLADSAISHSLSIRDEGSNGISSRGPLNNDIGGFLASERMPYPLSNQEVSSPNRISMSAPASNDPDQNARFIALSNSHSRFKPNSSISPHIDHQHLHPTVALNISSEHRENTSFLSPTHSIPDIEVAPPGNLPPSFPLTRNPFISSSVLMDSGHELVHGASTIGLQRHGSSSLAGFLARTNNEGSSSGNSSDDGSYERQGPPAVAATASHQHIKEPSPFFEGYTWDEAGNVMTGSANSAAIGAAAGAAAYNRKAFRDSDKYYTGHTPVDSQTGNTLEQGALANHFALGTATSPESIYFTDRLSTDSIPCRTRAKRGCATHPRSIAERVRRTKISERMKKLQELVPNMDKHTNTAEMLDEAVEYVKGLQHQVKELTEAQAKCSCSYNNTGKDQ